MKVRSPLCKVVDVIQCGVGGFGANYVEGLLADGAAHGVRLVAAVDPEAERRPAFSQLTAARVPCFPTLSLALERHRPQLVVLSTPIHCHTSDAVLALEAGCHVLCEKPAAGSLENAKAMAAAAARAGRFLAVGYQWSFSPCVMEIKRRIRNGEFGRPLRLLTQVRWPRPWSYYTRNGWAGARATPDGLPINDSPINNAAAHFLHNMLFLLGGSPDASVGVIGVASRVCRAYPIQNFDTAALRVDTDLGASLFLYASHAVAISSGPHSVFEFERGEIQYTADEGRFVWCESGGRPEDLGSPDADGQLDKLWQCASAAREGDSPLCGIQAALAQTQVIEAVQRNHPAIATVPSHCVARHEVKHGDFQLEIHDLAASFQRAFAQRALPDRLFG